MKAAVSGLRQGRSVPRIPDGGRADLLSRFLVSSLLPFSDGNPSGSLPFDDAEIAKLVRTELAEVVATSDDLRQLLEPSSKDQIGEVDRSGLAASLSRALLAQPEKMRTLWKLLEISGDAEWAHDTQAAASASGPGEPWPRRRRLREGGGVLAAVATAVLGVLLLAREQQVAVLKCFAIVVLATVPGWLFLRFIVYRAGALWTEYVLNLHRLGFDQHEYLPEPPATSGYHHLWYEGGGSLLVGSPNVYRQKFEAYYGKSVASLTSGMEKAVVTDSTLVPVYLSTLIFAAGWTAVLWRDPLFAGALTLPVDALRFAFMGAYSFVLQMMIRRYFQSDLKASAYLSAITRVVTVVILVMVVYWTLPTQSWMTPGQLCGTAFIIGFFPLVGMQLLQKGLTAQARRWLPTLENPYPLSDLIGLNVWYEARLLEEGIEDMENLTSANLVDVLLHTRVPVGRLVDWIDQAHLHLALEPFPSHRDEKLARREEKRRQRAQGKAKAEGPALPPPALMETMRDLETATKQRRTLRRLGVRGATDLEALFLTPEKLHHRSLSPAVLAVDGATFEAKLRRVLNDPDDTGPSVAEAMLKIFCNSPGLVSVRHWRDMLLRDCHADGDLAGRSDPASAATGSNGFSA